MTADRDYYDVLGVEEDASTAEIRRAYHHLVRRYHPDLTSRPDAERRFQEITEAYTVLIDPESRAAYDEEWSTPHRQQRPAAGFHLGVDLGVLRVSLGVGQVDDPVPPGRRRPRR